MGHYYKSDLIMGAWLGGILDITNGHNFSKSTKNKSSDTFNSELSSSEFKFLMFLVDNDIRSFTYLPENMEIEEPEIKELLQAFNKEEMFNIINSLSQKEYLSKEDLDTNLQCPNCFSKNLNVKYICPKCNTGKVMKYEIIEHPYCGYRDIKTKFITKGGLSCPQCNSILTRKETQEESSKEKKSVKYSFLNTYRINGTYFQCMECNNKLERPNIGFICRDCGTEFNHINGVYQIPYKYTINNEAFKKIKARNKIDLLIVEDNEMQSELLAMILKDSEGDKKYDIKIAHNGEDAIKLLKNNDFTCIIQDLGLPDIDGIALLKKIKSLKPDAKVIVFTGYDDREIAVNAMKNGASEFLIKNDGDPELLIKKIETVINS